MSTTACIGPYGSYAPGKCTQYNHVDIPCKLISVRAKHKDVRVYVHGFCDNYTLCPWIFDFDKDYFNDLNMRR